MERLQGGGQPLYGRPNWSARIRPFDYRDSARMMPNRSPREAALLYGMLGGTPRYLAALDESESPAESVIRTLLSPRGEVHLQVQYVVGLPGEDYQTKLPHQLMRLALQVRAAQQVKGCAPNRERTRRWGRSRCPKR